MTERGKWVSEELAAEIHNALNRDGHNISLAYQLRTIPLSDLPDLERAALEQKVIEAAIEDLDAAIASLAKPKRKAGWYWASNKHFSRLVPKAEPEPWFWNGNYWKLSRVFTGSLNALDNDFDWISDTPLELERTAKDTANAK